MTIVSSQRRIFLELFAALRPHLRSDLALPERIRRLLSGDRRLGARDRRLYRELLYTTVRYLPWIEPLLDSDPEQGAARVAWLAADTPDTGRYREGILSDWPAVPKGLFERATHLGARIETLLPPWLAEECPAALAPQEVEALHRRAPLWLRFQNRGEEGAPSGADAVGEELSPNGWVLRGSPLLDSAFEARRGEGGEVSDLTGSAPFLRGAFEVQDLGSQFLLESVGIVRGERWLDPCAGAGGKSLQLARLVGAEGSVEAHDPRADALAELARRRDRTGIRNLHLLSEAPAFAGEPSREYDGVLIDAPCSGSGTWRRAPHLKWTTDRTDLARQAERQGQLLRTFAKRVRPGGRLVYATCSLARSENEEVVRGFLGESPDFEPLPLARDFGYPRTEFGLSLLPARHDTDGFFVAVLGRRDSSRE